MVNTYVTNLRIGDERINLFLDERFVVSYITNAFVPTERSIEFPAVFPMIFEAGDKDVYGADIVDYTDSSTIPIGSRITFPEIEGFDVFDRTNSLIWNPNNLLYDGFGEEFYPRRWGVSTLLRGNEFLSSLTIGAWKVFVRESGGVLKQIIAYSTIYNYNYNIPDVVEDFARETRKTVPTQETL